MGRSLRSTSDEVHFGGQRGLGKALLPLLEVEVGTVGAIVILVVEARVELERCACADFLQDELVSVSLSKSVNRYKHQRLREMSLVAATRGGNGADTHSTRAQESKPNAWRPRTRSTERTTAPAAFREGLV